MSLTTTAERTARFDQLKHAPLIPNEQPLLELFDACAAVTPEEIVSRWHGGGFNLGNPNLQRQLESGPWYGKWFVSTERGGALPLICWDNKGCLYSNAQGGPASLRALPFRGQVTTAMASDAQPSADYFRKVDDAATILMAIAAPIPDQGRYMIFYMTRIAEWPAPFDSNEH